VRVPPASIEEDDLMPPSKRGFDDVPTEEERPAEDQKSHDIGSRAEGVSVLRFGIVAVI
jgi:hypothetical protein